MAQQEPMCLLQDPSCPFTELCMTHWLPDVRDKLAAACRRLLTAASSWLASHDAEQGPSLTGAAQNHLGGAMPDMCLQLRPIVFD